METDEPMPRTRRRRTTAASHDKRSSEDATTDEEGDGEQQSQQAVSQTSKRRKTKGAAVEAPQALGSSRRRKTVVLLDSDEDVRAQQEQEEARSAQEEGGKRARTKSPSPSPEPPNDGVVVLIDLPSDSDDNGSHQHNTSANEQPEEDVDDMPSTPARKTPATVATPAVVSPPPPARVPQAPLANRNHVAPTLYEKVAISLQDLVTAYATKRKARNYRDMHKVLRPRVIGKLGSGPIEFHYPCGLSFDPQGNLVVADQANHRIQVISHTGKHLRDVASHFDDDVYSVSSSVEGNIWATSSSNRVTLYNGSTGVVLRSFECTSPYGVAALNDGFVAVTCWDARRVELYDSKGKLRWSSPGGPGGFGGYVNGIALIPELDLLACTDYDNSRVQLLSVQTGEFVRQIGYVGAMNDPVCVAYDQVARVLVVGEDHGHNLSAWAIDSGNHVATWGNGSFGNFGAISIAVSHLDGSIVAGTDATNHALLVF